MSNEKVLIILMACVVTLKFKSYMSYKGVFWFFVFLFFFKQKAVTDPESSRFEHR